MRTAPPRPPQEPVRPDRPTLSRARSQPLPARPRYLGRDALKEDSQEGEGEPRTYPTTAAPVPSRDTYATPLHRRPPRLAHPPDQQRKAHEGYQDAGEVYAKERHERRAPHSGKRVPQGVQDHRRRERPPYPPVERRVPHLEPLAPQHSAHQPRPGGVSRGRHQPALQEHPVQHAQVALRKQQRGEPVAHSLERGEAHGRGDSKDYARRLGTVTAKEVEDEWQDQLGALLYHTYAQLGQDPEAPHHVVLEAPGHDRPQHPAPDEADRQGGQRHLPVGEPLVEVGGEGHRHQEGAEQDRGGDEVGVACGDQGPLDEEEQDESANEDLEPASLQEFRASNLPERAGSRCRCGLGYLLVDSGAIHRPLPLCRLPEQAGVFYVLDGKHADDAAFPRAHLDVCRWLHGSYLLSVVAGLSTEA